MSRLTPNPTQGSYEEFVIYDSEGDDESPRQIWTDFLHRRTETTSTLNEDKEDESILGGFDTPTENSFSEEDIEVLSSNIRPKLATPQNRIKNKTKKKVANKTGVTLRRPKVTITRSRPSRPSKKRIHQLFEEATRKVFQAKPRLTRKITPDKPAPAKKYQAIAPKPPLNNVQVVSQTIPTIQNNPIYLWPQPIVLEFGYAVLAPRCPFCQGLFATHEFLIQHMAQHAVTEEITRELTVKNPPRTSSPERIKTPIITVESD